MISRISFGAGRSRLPRAVFPGALVALLLAGCVPPPAELAPEPVKRVRIVHTNDFHGRLLPQEPAWAEGRAIGGSAVLAAHFDSARARFEGPTILLSAGDDFQGTAISNLSWGRATVDVFNAKRYDAAALGNHEFDWGLDTLQARVRESRFPWMAANIFRAGTTEHPEWIRPWVMIERNGVRVAVIGIALSTTPQIVVAGRTEGVDFHPEPPAIDRAVREARAAGADFVVVTTHIGATCEQPGREPEEESQGCRGHILEIMDQITERVDLIVGGHTHQRVITTHAGMLFMEAAQYSTHYSITDLERHGDSVRVAYRAVHNAWADEVTPDTAVARIVTEWDERVRPLTERVVIYFTQPMERRGGEHPLGNLLADAQRLSTGAHVGLVNNGSIRRDMPGGPITFGMLFELQPFQNEMVAVHITGAVLRQALEHALTGEGRPRAHISGMSVRYDPAAPQGSRIREIRLDDGRILRDTDPVTLGTTEFVATGGDAFAMLREGRLVRSGLIDLDVLIQHLQSLPQPIQPPPVGRWVPTR